MKSNLATERVDSLHTRLTCLTTIKLALQVVQRRPSLCQQEDGPLQKALDATNALIAESGGDHQPRGSGQ
jgi:hypothetical protein